MTLRTRTTGISAFKTKGLSAAALKIVAVSTLAVGLAVAPVGAASAHDRFFRGPGPLFWPFAAAATLVTRAVVIATAPIRALAGPPAYYAAPAYYAPPAPAYYAQPPVYAPPAYYPAPQPGYAQ